MNQLRYEIDAEGVATLTFDSPDGPVNTMSLAWQQDFIACVDRVIAEKDKLRGVILASAKKSFLRRRRPEGRATSHRKGCTRSVPQHRGDQGGIPQAGAFRPAGGGGDQWRRARRRLGDLSCRAPAHLHRRPENRTRLPRGEPGPAAGRGRRDQDGAPARPAGGAADAGRRQAAAAGRGDEAEARRRVGRRSRRAAGERARLDRRESGTETALGPEGLQNTRRRCARARRRPDARRRACGADAEDARPVSGARSDTLLRRRRHVDGLRLRHAQRVALSRQTDDRAGRAQHDHRVLFQSQRDQVGRLAPEGRAEMESVQGGHTRRRHDGRGHRLRQRRTPHPLRAEGCHASDRRRRARHTVRSCWRNASSRGAAMPQAPRRRWT